MQKWNDEPPLANVCKCVETTNNGYGIAGWYEHLLLAISLLRPLKKHNFWWCEHEHVCIWKRGYFHPKMAVFIGSKLWTFPNHHFPIEFPADVVSWLGADQFVPPRKRFAPWWQPLKFWLTQGVVLALTSIWRNSRRPGIRVFVREIVPKWPG